MDHTMECSALKSKFKMKPKIDTQCKLHSLVFHRKERYNFSICICFSLTINLMEFYIQPERRFYKKEAIMHTIIFRFAITCKDHNNNIINIIITAMRKSIRQFNRKSFLDKGPPRNFTYFLSDEMKTCNNECL